MKFVILAILLASPVFADAIIDELQEISVTIDSCSGQGSGILIARGHTTYVLTAAHVVEGCRKTRKTNDAEGHSKTIVYFEPVNLVRQLIEDGTTVGRISATAEIIRYSDSDHGDDVALLKVKKKDFTTHTATFYLDSGLTDLGTPLWHVGSLLGEEGFNSLTSGILSQHGRMIEGKEYDQVTCPIQPGSSGGGVFLTDGRYVGMVLRGAGETFALMLPVRRIRVWAKRCDAEFVLDPTIKKFKDDGPIEDPLGAGPEEEPTRGHWGGLVP